MDVDRPGRRGRGDWRSLHDAGTLYEESICVGDGCYAFTINDSFGDGILLCLRRRFVHGDL